MPPCPLPPAEAPIPLRSVSDPRPLDDRDPEPLLAEYAACTDPGRRSRLEHRIVLLTLPLADAAAHRYRGRGIDLDDLVQVARLALVKAVRGYRPGRGPGFAAYAGPTISGELKRHFRDHGWAIRPPRRLQEVRASLLSEEEALWHRLARSPTDRELAAALGVETTAVREARTSAAGYASLSLDRPGSGSDGALDPRDDRDVYARFEQSVVLRQAIDRLSPRERRIIRLRFVEELTQSEIGEILGVSQMQVSRLLKGILSRLRGSLEEPPWAV